MLRIPIRVRVTAVFAVALAIVLAGTGVFQNERFRSGFDHALDQGLRSRAGDVTALVMQADSGLAQGRTSKLTARGEAFAQILDANGRIFDSTPQIKRVVLLGRRDLLRALAGPIFLERGPIARIPDPSRLFALPIRAQGRRLVVVVGVSLGERRDALSQLGGLLLLGGVIALLLVSTAGYVAVVAALRPIELMRRRAADISAREPGLRLPVPPADDEVARLGNTLNAMLVRLEDAYARERQFVSDASHELRTPLGILKTELELALRGSYTQGELQDALRSAAEEADRVVQLAEDLLVIARADQGRLPVNCADIELTQTFSGVRDRFARRAAEHDRPLAIEPPAHDHIWADPLRLEQALGNMVDNALRYGAGPVTITAAQTPTAVELHVTDRGPGFSDAFVEGAFDRFTREGHGRSRGGAGLGLAIVRAIAAAHGGEARATNRADGGADVWITVPQHPSAAG